MEGKIIDTLSTLALKSSIRSLKKSINRFKIECYSYSKEIEELVFENKDVQDLIHFHQQHREYLSGAKKFDDFRRIYKGLNFETIDGYFSTLMFWLCFENAECDRWKHWGIMPEDKIILNYLKKNQLKLLKCRTVAMEIGDRMMEFQDLQDIFQRIPNVEDLRINIWKMVEPDSKKILFSNVIPRLQYLKTLKTTIYDQEELTNFCDFVKKSPKNLEFLEIECETLFDDYGKYFCTTKRMFKALKKLPMLKVCNLSLTSGGEPLTARMVDSICLKGNEINTVRNMKLWIDDNSSLKLINNCFKGLKVLHLWLQGF